jgi:hypothetical protein
MMFCIYGWLGLSWGQGHIVLSIKNTYLVDIAVTGLADE